MVGCAQRHRAVIAVDLPVYRTAVERGFDYDAQLDSALGGNVLALTRLLCFSEHTDAGAALLHGIVLAQVLEIVGDERFALAVQCCDDECRERAYEVIQTGKDPTLLNGRCIDVRDYPQSFKALAAPPWTG